MTNSYNEIDVQTAMEQNKTGVLLLDVREADEFQAGHAQGAISIPLSELKDRLDEIDKSTEFNIICKSGGRSAQASMALNQLGYKTSNVKGGSLEWVANGQPFISETTDEPQVI